MREFIQLLIASAAYATGGLFMKFSDGLSKPLPTIVFMVLFIFGAGMQARGMRAADLGIAYILVLGLEAAVTMVFSALVLGESFSRVRTAALVLVLAGVAMLSQT